MPRSGTQRQERLPSSASREVMFNDHTLQIRIPFAGRTRQSVGRQFGARRSAFSCRAPSGSDGTPRSQTRSSHGRSKGVGC